MQSNESSNLTNSHGQPPECFGRTILSLPRFDRSATEVLRLVIEVWKPVADWGTWSDEDLGDWPSDDECLATLPDWFRRAIEQQATFSTQAWIGDLHDRDWKWYSGSIVDGCAKIDLESQSLPMTMWMLEVVIDTVGGRVIYKDKWLSDEDAIILVRSRSGDSEQ